jgi:hypothetical protein
MVATLSGKFVSTHPGKDAERGIRVIEGKLMSYLLTSPARFQRNHLLIFL